MIPSLPKLLGLIAIIWVIWTLFRIYEARQAAIRAQHTKNGGESRHETAGQDRHDDDQSVDLRECKSCGAWFSGENCGRENCSH